uniref:GCF C-terminal domain-containing protein n=1 Tax=Oryza glumipatula TaxID=40148 RepID=A0A0D9ZN38_9ORYZ
MRWASIVPVKYMVPLLIQGFFKKWMYANYRYLMGERSRLDEAMAWYEVWKRLFTLELLAEKRVVVHVEASLDMINRATQGLEISAPRRIDPIEMTSRPRNAALGAVEGSHGWEALDIERTLATLREESAAYAAKRAQKTLRASGSASTARRLVRSSHDGEDRGPVSAEEEIVSAMAVIRGETSSRTLTLGGLICEFEGLKEKFPEAYGTFQLAQTAAHLTAPWLRPLLRPQDGRWDILQRPAWALALVQSLRNILQEEEDASSAGMSAYAMLIDNSPWNVSATPSRCSGSWRRGKTPSRHRRWPSSSWRSWSPTWWTEPASVWVSPWIPHLGVDRLHGVYLDIAGELGRWMKGRDVTRCAYGKVSQWKGVFDPETWDEFVTVQRHVVPVVSRSLRDPTISPTRTWGGSNTFPLVMRWALLVPARYMVPVLESEFFAKWRYAVYPFVTEVRPIPGKAAVWYQSWKDLFTPELLADERVLLQLETGLGMINRASADKLAGAF